MLTNEKAALAGTSTAQENNTPDKNNNCLNIEQVTILTSTGPRLAKRWASLEAAPEGYDDAKHFSQRQVAVADIHALHGLLDSLRGDPRTCVIRGRYVGDDPDGVVLRRGEVFQDVPHHWVMLDVDGHHGTVDPIQDPYHAFDEWVRNQLPAEFQGVTFIWHLSGSAGHPLKPGLRGHVWFWLKEPASSASLRASALPVDKTLFQAVQAHYTADPVMADGIIDPVPLRMGLVHDFCDEVDWAPAAVTHTVVQPDNMRDPREIPGIVGAFCSAFSPVDVLNAEWFDGNFEHVTGERWTWLDGSGAPEGVRVTDSHLINMHATSPQGLTGRALNAFDVVRVYMFGDRDSEENEWAYRTPATRPSHQAAKEFAQSLPEVLAVSHAYTRKNGKILATLTNVVTAVSDPDMCGAYLGFDRFRAEAMLHRGDGQWLPFGDEHYTELRLNLTARGFAEISRENIRDAVDACAKANGFDSAVVWLESLRWDGIPRVATFNHRYLGAEDTPYSRAVAVYQWTASAGRVLVPGVQADMVPIWVGDQGVGKSTAVSALVPAPDFACEISFHETEDNLARKMRGTLVAEIGELRGLKTKDLEGIKSFITRSHEKWTPKFKEFTTTFPRRLIFIGTTNEARFLADDTGNRRWLPVEVGSADRDAIIADRDQLWAEAAVMFRRGGVHWQDAERLAADVHARYELRDPWEEEIGDWLQQQCGFDAEDQGSPPVVSAKSILVHLKIDPVRHSPTVDKRIAGVMKLFGYQKSRKQIAGDRGQKFERLPV